MSDNATSSTLIAIAIIAAGERSVLGVEVAAAGCDEGSSWLPFLRSLITARRPPVGFPSLPGRGLGAGAAQRR